MSIYLIFDGANDVVSIPSAMTGNAGTGEYSFRVKSGPNGITVPASGLAGIIGTSQATGSNGLAVNASGQIRVYRTGANLYGSSVQLIFSGVAFDYTLTHLSSGAWDIYDNITGAPTGQSGTYTQAQVWSNGANGLNQFGRSSGSNSVYLNGEIELIVVTGLTNSDTWDANLSGGTGPVLPSVSGSNNGTLVNFPTDNSQWGGVGAAITGSAFVAMPQMAVAASGSVSVASLSATIALTMPQMSVAASASDSAPLVTASSAFAMPQFAVDASAIASVPTFTASASVTMPQMSAAISGSVVISGNAASLSFAMPQMAVVGAAADTAPTFSASVASTMPQMQVQCQALSVASGVIASINMTMPQMSIAAIASDTSPAISASVSLTMPQFSVYAVSGGFSFYESDGAHIETIAASSHLEYTYQSTHIEWRA